MCFSRYTLGIWIAHKTESGMDVVVYNGRERVRIGICMGAHDTGFQVEVLGIMLMA